MNRTRPQRGEGGRTIGADIRPSSTAGAWVNRDQCEERALGMASGGEQVHRIAGVCLRYVCVAKKGGNVQGTRTSTECLVRVV